MVRILVGRAGLEPAKQNAADLQSAPFTNLGTCPFIKGNLDMPGHSRGVGVNTTSIMPSNHFAGA